MNQIEFKTDGTKNMKNKKEKKQEYQDNTDRIGIEREFSLEKHSYGLGLITTKLEQTQLASIALSVFVANLFKMQRRILCALLELWGLHGFPEGVIA